LGRFGGGLALEHLPAGFFLAADQQTALLGGRQRLGAQLADGVSFGLKVLVVAIEPILTFVGLKIDILQDAPDA